MVPGLVSQKIAAAKLDAISEMLGSIESLPLASENEFTRDPHMVAMDRKFLSAVDERMGRLNVGPSPRPLFGQVRHVSTPSPNRIARRSPPPRPMTHSESITRAHLTQERSPRSSTS